MSGIVRSATKLVKSVVKPITSIFSPPSAPAAPKIPEVPQVMHEKVQAAADTIRRRERGATGKAATMLTGGTGVLEDIAVATKKLLGR